MNQFNESSNKIKRSCDIEIVKLKDDAEIAKFKKFYKSIWPNKEPCIHPLNDGAKVALLCSNGDAPYFSGRWFELYLSHICRQGARYWKELDDFIANYDVRAHKAQDRAFIRRTVKEHLASPDINLDQFLDDLKDVYGNIVFQLPHASTKLPFFFVEDCCLNNPDSYFAYGRESELRLTNLKMSDVMLSDLIQDYEFPIVVPKYSCLYVDVDKVWYDSKEKMAKYGLGAVYRKDYLGRTFHNPSHDYLLQAKRCYDAYHENLRQIIEKQDGDVLLINLQSFNDEVANVISKGPYPDVCIGFKQDYDGFLIELIEGYCDARGLSHARNFPFKGSNNVPKVVGKKITAVTIFINKRVYL